MFLPVARYIYFMKKTLSIVAAGLLLAGCSSNIETASEETVTSEKVKEVPTGEWETIGHMTEAIQYATGSCENFSEDVDMGACGTDGGIIQYAINRTGGEDVALHLRIIALENDRTSDEAVLWGDGWTILCADDTASDCDLINGAYPGGNLVELDKGEGVDVRGELEKFTNGIQDGIHLVGEEVQPGTYKYNGESSRCYWARLSGLSGDSSDILANGNENAQAYVAIAPSDKAFESRGCGFWELVEE